MSKVVTRFGVTLGMILGLVAVNAWAHGDVTPHPLETSNLPQLGKEWVDNPYRGNADAIEVGKVGYLHNCAGCHGLNGISGGVAPDLLKVTADCAGMAKSAQPACLKETDDYFKDIVMDGKKTSDGRYTMPGYGSVFTQEAVWALKSYLDQRTIEEAAKAGH